MSPYQKKQQYKQRKNFFRKWHRRIGFTAALFLVNLAITGILLNHSDELSLHKRYVTSNWLVEWYGVKAPSTVSCLPELISGRKICQIAEKIYSDNNLLVEESTNLRGFLEHQQLIYLATENTIYIYTKEMLLVEILNNDSDLPTPLSSIHRLKPELLDTFKLPSNEMNRLKSLYLGRQITLLKLVQDLHSGRILSLPGKLLVDLVGIIVILLSISGFIAWRRRKDKTNE